MTSAHGLRCLLTISLIGGLCWQGLTRLGEVPAYCADSGSAGQVSAGLSAPRATNRDSVPPELWTARRVYITGTQEEALAAFEKVVQAYPSSKASFEALSSIARIYQSRGEATKAISAVDKAINSCPLGVAMFAAYVDAASVYEALGDAERCRRAWCFASIAAPNNAECESAIERIVKGYLDRSAYGDAAKYLESASQSYPKTALAPLGLLYAGRYHLQSGDSPSAERTLLCLVQLYPTAPAVREGRTILAGMYDDRATTCLQKGDTAGSVSNWKRAHAADCDVRRRAERAYRGAAMLVEKRQFDAARQLLNVVRSDKSEAVLDWREKADYLDAVAYHESGNNSTALALLARLESSSRQHEQRRLARELMRQLAGQGNGR